LEPSSIVTSMHESPSTVVHQRTALNLIEYSSDSKH